VVLYLCVHLSYQNQTNNLKLKQMETIKTTVKQQIESKTAWMEMGTMLYVIDYTDFVNGTKSEKEVEDSAYTYWETKTGIQFQDKRSKFAYENNLLIIAAK